jgi:hypothetical protein
MTAGAPFATSFEPGRSIRWAEILPVLSLDVMAPLFGPMGLGELDEEALVQAVRKVILDAREAAAASGQAPSDLGAGTFRIISAEIGEAAAIDLRRWAGRVYQRVHADLPQWSGWRIAFEHATSREERVSLLALPPDDRNEIVELFFDIMDMREVEHQIEVLKRRPLSDWDVAMYARHGFDHDDELNDPFDIVRRAVQMARFQRFAERLVERLTPTQEEEVRSHAETLLAAKGVVMPGPLASLRQLTVGAS